MNASRFFTKEQQQILVDAIKAAEKETSGEIRVHIETACNEDVLDRAAWVFKKLQMHKTKQRNGVLIYLAIASHKFAIIGDSGINAVTPDDFWDVIKEKMLSNFQHGKFVEGLMQAVESAGIALKKYFPYHTDDANEQPDEISFG